nr:DNA internalization-related competence protein ComEC/Rec2 [Streptococcus plurextorum]
MIWVYFAVMSAHFLAISGLICLVICLFRSYPLKDLLRPLLVLMVFGGYLGLLQWQSRYQVDKLPDRLTSIQVIPDTISINGDRLSFQGKSDGQRYQAFYTLSSKEEQSYFQKLDQTVILELDAELTEPEGKGNFNGFDYKTYLKTQGIYRLAQVKALHAVQKSPKLTVVDHLHEWRRKAIVYIEQTFPSPMSHYMTGLLFAYLPKAFEETKNLYTSLGIIHLFALSGSHVLFFVATFRYLLLRMGFKKGLTDLLLLPFSLIYAGLTGFSLSVIRSLLQINLANLGVKGLDNFAFSFMLMFLVEPHFLATVGGVLSFAYAFILSSTDSRRSNYPRLAEMLTINLGILPLLCWYFSSFQPLAIPLTALVSIVFDSFVLPLLSLCFVLSPLIRLDAFNWLFIGLENGLTLIGQLSQGPLIFGSPSLLVLLCSLLVLGLLYDATVQKKRIIRLSLLLALLFFVTKHPLENEVTLLNVGQGDSILLRDMWGKTVMIDVGGKVTFEEKEAWRQGITDSNAERTVIPYLKSRGIDRIDQLVLTHTDQDHVGDLEEVVGEFAIGEILVSPGSLTVPDFVKRLKQLGVPVRKVEAGDNLAIMGSHLHVLYPNQIGDGGNNDSLVLYGKLLDQTFLFTGDLEDGELDLIKTYPHLPVDILKAGHHGSKGSSYPEFLEHIDAKIALVSAGKNNRYKHPHQETLERFNKQKMIIYRTDQQGAVRFRGWRSWRIETVW